MWIFHHSFFFFFKSIAQAHVLAKGDILSWRWSEEWFQWAMKHYLLTIWYKTFPVTPWMHARMHLPRFLCLHRGFCTLDCPSSLRWLARGSVTGLEVNWLPSITSIIIDQCNFIKLSQLDLQLIQNYRVSFKSRVSRNAEPHMEEMTLQWGPLNHYFK